MVVLGMCLDFLILEVFSNLDDSMMLCRIMSSTKVALRL